MMWLVLVVLAATAGLSLASLLALYSYGRFAAGAQGEPSAALPVSDTATEIDRIVAPLLAEQIGRSGLVLLSDNLDAFAVRALSARRAGRSLDLQYYMWKDDFTGRLLIKEVLDAADRGVRVRVLLDDINARPHDRATLALDAHPNIAVRLFNPCRSREGALRRGLELLLRAVSATRRMHNKSWIADGRMTIVGGRNIGDAYFDADRIANFRDLDVLVLGAGVPQAESVFDGFWNSKAVIPITALRSMREANLPGLRQRLAGIASDPRAQPYLRRVAEEAAARDMLADKGRIHWIGNARIVSDPPEKVIGTGEDKWLIRGMAPILAAASAELEIISPYFIPGEAGTATLVDMAQRGLKVAVLTNSLAATDVAAVHGAYARCRKPLLAGGVSLFELKPYDERSRVSLFGSSSASLHTKAFTVDRRHGFIGSMNFDPRSVSLNTEMGVAFEDTRLAAEVGGIFADETSAPKSYRLGIEDSGIVWRDVSGGAARILRTEPEARAWQRLVAWIISLLPVESQL